jgi:fructosamine-3-kinase
VDEPGRLRLEQMLGLSVLEAHRLGGQHGVDHFRLLLADGRSAFAKIAGHAGVASQIDLGGRASQGDQASRAGFAAESAGLRWLADADAAPVPAVLAADDTVLVLEWVAEAGADRHAAARFGSDLARLHRAGAGHFGAPWPGVIAGLPLPNAEADEWPAWYAGQRLLPYVRLAADSGAFSPADARLVESVADRITELAGPAELPSRIHGDCWSGNVLWSGGRGWLIDPAAHGGHRETDLAMLSLFGAPHLDLALDSYQDIAPLADGWRNRIPLHQLHPLLVHVCLFGAAYRDAALRAARAVLRS